MKIEKEKEAKKKKIKKKELDWNRSSLQQYRLNFRY